MNILDHSEQLSSFGISLHSRIVESLVTQIETAIEMGLIRFSQSSPKRHQLFSIYDFIRVILKLKTERQVWKRFVSSTPNVVTICDYVKFSRKDGEINRESPGTDIAGLLYISYLANCDFSHNLRVSSAAYFAADRKPIASPVQVAAVSPDNTVGAPTVTFNRALTEIHEISGIKSAKYVATAVKRDLELGIDYVQDGDALLLTDDAFNWLVVSFRSQRGTDTARLPENISLTRRGFRLAVSRKNARIACAANSPTEACSQIVRSHNVSPVSLANLLPMSPKYGKGRALKDFS